MTTGSIVLDRSPFSRYAKTWSGTNWGSPEPPSGLTSYWARTEQSLSSAEHSGYKRVKGQKRPPARATLEDHPYNMDLEFWMDPTTAKWNVYDIYPPYKLLGTEEYRFRALYGAGYSSNFGTSWDSNDDIRILGKLRERIVGSDFDMGVFLGEGKETLSLIASTAKRVNDYYRGFRRMDVRAVSRALGIPEVRVSKAMDRARRKADPPHVRAAQANLELQYGWMPLVQDAEGAAQALAQQLNNPAVQTYKVRSRKAIRLLGIGSPNIKTFEYDGNVRAQYIARLTEANVAALNGLVDPSSVLWELTPWSFVADWFIPIGNYLQARGFANAVSGKFVKTITRRESFYANSGARASGPVEIIQQPSYRHMRVNVSRTVSSSISVPTPSFKRLADVPNWKRALNAVSLLITNFASTSGKQAPGLSRRWG